jgi:hypothetical protein
MPGCTPGAESGRVLAPRLFFSVHSGSFAGTFLSLRGPLMPVTDETEDNDASRHRNRLALVSTIRSSVWHHPVTGLELAQPRRSLCRKARSFLLYIGR